MYAKYESTINYTRPLLFSTILLYSVNSTITLVQETYNSVQQEKKVKDFV